MWKCGTKVVFCDPDQSWYVPTLTLVWLAKSTHTHITSVKPLVGTVY